MRLSGPSWWFCPCRCSFLPSASSFLSSTPYCFAGWAISCNRPLPWKTFPRPFGVHSSSASFPSCSIRSPEAGKPAFNFTEANRRPVRQRMTRVLSSISDMGKEFSIIPHPVPRVETRYRRIAGSLPHPDSLATLETLRQFEPQSMRGQPPVVWDRAEDIFVFDKYGNQWL